MPSPFVFKKINNIDFYEKKGIVISADNSKSPDVAFAQASEALAAKGFRKA